MAEWKRRFWKTALSGYIGVIVRMLLGLILFRQMFQGLSAAEFGFWALLWSLFGYGVLLDFGFGFTAQKAVAEKTAVGDMPGLSRLLATILWTFVGLAVVLLALFWGIRGPFLSGMGVAEANLEEFGRAYLIFFIGMALMFPLGLFPEILRGLQRVDLANWISTGSVILNFAGLVWGLHAGWSFSTLMAVSVATSALPNLCALVLALRRLPGLSLSPRGFEWRSVRAQMGFSIAAYLITFSNLLMAKSDQLVISLTVGVAAIAIYQAGYKMGEMLNLFSVQLQAALSPAAAALRAGNDEAGLRELLLNSSRITFLLVTPCYLLAAVHLEALIALLTGLDQVPRETWWIGQALLLAVYSSQLTNACAKRVLMMCGEERKLLTISLTDAALNVGLSIVLAYQLGVLGVAIGTLVPTALVGWLWVVPLTLKRLDLGLMAYLGHHLRGALLPLAVFGLVLAGLELLVPAGPDAGLFSLGWRGALCFAPVALLGLRTLRDMTR